MTSALQPKTLTEVTVFCAEAIDMTGSAITLSMASSASSGIADSASGGIAGSNVICLGLQHEQSLLGEGPANDARSNNSVVAVPDFAENPDSWPIFSPIATRAGIRSALALPLTAGFVCLGALVFYNASVTTYSRKLVGKAKCIAVDATNFIRNYSDPRSTRHPAVAREEIDQHIEGGMTVFSCRGEILANA